MNPSQAMIGISLAGAAGGYALARGVLAMRAAPPARRDLPPTDPLAPGLAAALPAMSGTRKELQQHLWTAGFYRPGALTEYLAFRAVLFLGPLIATGLLALLVPAGRVAAVLIGGLLVSGLGFSLPRLVLNGLATARARRLVRALPVAMDILGLCLTAGQNLLGSLEQTSRELAGPYPDLSTELQIVQQQARMASLEQALLQWADRLDVPEVRTLAMLLVQSDKLGTDMVNTLLEVADSQRIHLRQKAEAQANRSNFWMLFPSVFCLWIASAILLVGPVYIEFWKYRRDQMNNLVRNSRTQVEKTNPARRATTETDDPTVVAPEPAAEAAPAAPRLTPSPLRPTRPAAAK
ncbi:MAG: type II secretion system F family protein [Gemmataceae bacterium]